MNYSQLYNLSYNYLVERAAEHDCFKGKDIREELEKYFVLTEEKALSSNYPMDSMNAVLFQMLFHAQNTSYKGGVIQFNKNTSVLKDLLCDFNAESILNTYDSEYELYDRLCESISTCQPSTKAKTDEVEGKIAFQYAKTVLSCCRFLQQFEDREALTEHLKKYGDILPIYLSYELDGFGIALSCDFLKEFSEAFDLPKPDIHIKELGKELFPSIKEARGDKLDYLTIKVLRETARGMTEATGTPVSCYKLDRIWWLICTEQFFLHDNKKNTKSDKRNAFIAFLDDRMLEELDYGPEVLREEINEAEYIEEDRKRREELGQYPFNLLNAVFGKQFLKDEYCWLPEEEATQVVDKLFGRLPRSLAIIALEYFVHGLGIEEIRKKYGVSLNEARLYVSKVIRMIRNPVYSRQLREAFKLNSADFHEYEEKGYPMEWYK